MTPFARRTFCGQLSLVPPCLLVFLIVGGRVGAAEEPPPVASTETAPRELSPAEIAALWYAANADWTGVAEGHTVARRFEMYNPHSVEHLAALREMGFDQVMLDWPNLHPDAARLGLDVVLANWWVDTTDDAEIERGLALAAEVAPGRLAGLSVMDEPERNSPDTPLEFYEELYTRLQPRLAELAPAARLEIAHWGPTWSWSDELYEAFVPLYRSADVMRIMPYPDLHEGPLSDVYFMMARSRRLMRLADRSLPLLVILQTWTLTPDANLPTMEELRVMAYQAVLGGAETVSFFDYNQDIWDRTPGFHEQFVLLMRELTTLSDQLADARLTTSMSDRGILTTQAMHPDGRVTTLRVNTNRTPVDGLPPLAVTRSTSCAPCPTAGTPSTHGLGMAGEACCPGNTGCGGVPGCVVGPRGSHAVVVCRSWSRRSIKACRRRCR